MSKVFISYIMRPLFLLKWDLGVPLGFLMTYVFQSCWIQTLFINVRNIFLIIIFTLEVLKGDKLLPNWRFLILYYIQSLKIFIKHQMKLKAYVDSL